MRLERRQVAPRKVHALAAQLGDYRSLGVAFSGGVDSTVLLMAAHKALGKRVVAITAVSGIHPSGEKELAIAIARRIGVRHELLPTDELEDPLFTRNPVDRCYHCKRHLFGAMQRLAADLGLQGIAHGANLDDLTDFRPGLQAAREMAIAAPLIDAELSKAEIRELARQWGLDNWDRPAMACLATRIPYGNPIQPEDLARIDGAERALHSLGIGYSRVRHYGDMARIEIDPDRIAFVAASPLRTEIIKLLKGFGYVHICLDLEGYTSGKMNRGMHAADLPSSQTPP